MKCTKETMLLYAVTDREWSGNKTLLEQVEAAIKGGATCIQLREKDLDAESLLAEAIEMKALCSKYNVPFIINDHAEIAIKCGANGVHIGQKDMDAGNVRALVGEHMMIGVSVQTVEQALEAEKAGADYLGVDGVALVSAIFAAENIELVCITLRSLVEKMVQEKSDYYIEHLKKEIII